MVGNLVWEPNWEQKGSFSHTHKPTESFDSLNHTLCSIMLFLVVLVLVAVLLHVGAASEVVESAAELQRNAQRMVDERNEAVINIIADHLPELNREEEHKRRLFSHYTKYL